MSPRRRSFSYSRPTRSSAPNPRSTSRTSSTHILPLQSPPRQRRRASRSPDYSPRRGDWRRSFSRSRSRSQSRGWSKSPIRHADYCGPRRRRNHAKRKSPETGPRRRLSRSFSKDRYRRSRSQVRKPLQKPTRDVAKNFAKPKHWKTMSVETSFIKQDHDLARTMKRGSESLEPGEVSASEFVHLPRPLHPLPPRPSLKFASSIKLSDAIISSLVVSPAQHSNVPKVTKTAQKETIGTSSLRAAATPTDLYVGLPGQLGPSDCDILRRPDESRPNDASWGAHDQPGPSVSDMEVDGYLRTTKNPVTSKPADAEVAPLAYNLNGYINAEEDSTFAQATQSSPNEMTYPPAPASRDPRLARPPPQGSSLNHILRSSGKSRQGSLHECIQELAQAFTSTVKSKLDSEFQGRLSGGDEDAAQSGSKPDFQAYGNSAMRRCERMISAIVNDVLLQVKVKSEVDAGYMQGTEQTCSRCDSLEQRINVLEQQKLDEATLMTRMEGKMEKRMEQMIEARAIKSVRRDKSETILPPSKRRRLNTLPLPTSLFSDEENSEEKAEQRLTKLESTVSKWEKHLPDALAVGDNPAVRPGDMMDRISALEGDSKQVFGYLSVHHSALVSLNSALSLDPSKTLGQGLQRHLSNLRMEMAHMLTDVFASLEDSLARMIVGVIIKQTKLEMQAGYDTFSRELLGKIVPETLTKGKEPARSPTMASMSASEDLKHTIAPEIVLPAIRELPSMRR